MIRSYINLAIRNLFKYKGYSFINIFGLTLGMTTSILIFLFVQDEKHYDEMHHDFESIYRLESYLLSSGKENHWAPTSGFLHEEVANRYPEVLMTSRLYPTRLPETFNYGNDYYSESRLMYGDSTFFNFFSFRVLQGDGNKALDAPNKIVLTERTAIKYFGNDDPLGKILKNEGQSYIVSAIVENLPHNSHFHFDLLLPISDLRKRRPTLEKNGPFAFYTYLKLINREVSAQLQAKLDKDIYEIYKVTNDEGEIGPPEGLTFRALFIPLTDIHLYSHSEKQLGVNNDPQYIYIFSTVAIFVLVIACFNYMNLATARSIKRAREVGMRKVLGAHKHHVFLQFIGESFFFTLIATVFAVLAVILLIPSFNEFTGKQLPTNILLNLKLTVNLLITYLTVSVLSGFYPSLFLSNFRPLKALKSNVLTGHGNLTALYIRRGLVVLQFGISIFLIIGASTIHKQLKYIEDKDLGFEKEQVVVANLPKSVKESLPAIKQEMLSSPEVVAVSITSDIPGRRHSEYPVRIPDLVSVDDSQADDGKRQVRAFASDEDVVEVFGFEIVQGRGFSKEIPTDATSGFLLNETAVKEFGLEDDPIGRRFEYHYALPEPKAGHVVGVIKDYHFTSLHTKVVPLMIHVYDRYDRYMSIKIKSNDQRQTLDNLEKIWLSMVPEEPFDPFFLDDSYEDLYRTEMTMGTVITFFTILAVAIACMGLFGLASFITEQRTKEIGVRKVLGASRRSIMMALSREFIKLILLTNIVAAIPAYYFLNNWLERFAFRVSISPITFLVAGIAALLIALITISFKTYRAARANPVLSLRYE